MPNPNDYKKIEKSYYMSDCMRIKKEEGKENVPQNVAVCLHVWDKAKKVASMFLEASSIRLFLDDVRDPSEYGVKNVLWVKNYNEAIKQLKTGNVTWISFDNDLGAGKTGYDVAKFIEENVFHGKIPCPDWQIHSSNPKGRENITMAMKAAERFSGK